MDIKGRSYIFITPRSWRVKGKTQVPPLIDDISYECKKLLSFVACVITVSQIKVPLFGSTSTCVTLTVKSLGSWILTEPISTLNFSKSTIWGSKDKSSLVPRWSLRHLQKQKMISGKNYKKYPCTSLAEKKGERGGGGRYKILTQNKTT